MDEATRRIIEGLEHAIKAENEGQFFYRMAARSTSDAKGKDIFEQLAAEERQHESFLLGQLDSLKKTGKIDENLKLGKQETLSDIHPIFSDSLLDRIEDAHYEMTSLSIGIQLELNAIEFYKKEVEKNADNRAIANFYLQLVDWESHHYHSLLKQQEQLKEAYWTENRFSPF